LDLKIETMGFVREEVNIPMFSFIKMKMNRDRYLPFHCCHKNNGSMEEYPQYL